MAKLVSVRNGYFSFGFVVVMALALEKKAVQSRAAGFFLAAAGNLAGVLAACLFVLDCFG